MPTKTASRRAPARTKAAKPRPVEDEIDDLDEDTPEPVVEKKPAAKKKAPAKKKAKAAPEPEPVDEDELEEDDEDAEPEEKPKSKKSAPKREEPKYGTKWLAEYLSEKLGREIASYDLRAVLRRMARKGELEREIGATRERYSFGGPKDPVVKSILETIKSGAIDKDKKAKLAELKAKKASKKKAAEEPEDELEDEVEDLDDEDEDEDDE